MKLKSIGRGWVAVACSVILVGAGAVLVTPAANAVAAINWGSVWKNQLQPRADQRYFTKAQATRRFAPMPRVIRGAYIAQTTAAGINNRLAADISFGWSVGSAPTVHVIPRGGVLPTGCSGTVSRPNAAPGNLCVFENQHFNAGSPQVCDIASQCKGKASPMGAYVIAFSTAAGDAEVSGTWAVRPATTVSASKLPAVPVSRPDGPTGG